MAVRRVLLPDADGSARFGASMVVGLLWVLPTSIFCYLGLRN